MTLGVHVEENAVRRSQGKFSENIGTEEKKDRNSNRHAKRQIPFE
jgi:hypothetical protein